MNRVKWGAVSLALAGMCSTQIAGAEGASATGKGIAGGALIGAEAAVITESILDVKEPWIYALGASLGAAGGGVGGYFVEQNATPKISFYLLLGGMALMIPTTIVYFDATTYQPPRDLTRDRPLDEPLAEPPDPREGLEISQRGQRDGARRRIRVGGFIGLEHGELGWALPNVRVSDVFSKTEVAKLGVAQETQVFVPVFHGRF